MSHPEESQNLVEGPACRLAFAIDEMQRDYAMGTNRRTRQRARVGQDTTLEAVSECFLVRSETFGLAEAVTFETEGEHVQIFAVHALLSRSVIFGVELA
jgi:hypothetical protein